MTEPRRGGFTLVEVVVALVVTGAIALLAHGLFAAAADASHRLETARRRLDHESNAHGFQRDAFLALDVGADSAGPFEGEPRRVQFSAWLPVSGGWNERRRIILALNAGWWTADVGDEPSERVALADSVTSVGLDYLLSLGASAHWVGDWHSAVSAPLAVRVRLTRAGGACDTSLYLVKPRG
jgi:prepilin-type N-terminal cleavage/methylation domain-containing protein